MKYLKRIIIYCLISFTFISCHNKVKGTGMAEKDSLPVACLSDTIFYSNNTFLYYDKETGSWSFLPYPENFVREDLGIVIAPRIKQHHTFFSPIRDKILQGKYKLQLSFYTNSGKVHYYVSKVFVVKKMFFW